ncbi:CBS domain-containing protein [Candidatus Woesearchaeota archaeon]|nr:CBS domain-containing protein [Candidatus Woesearchaeota archaeon]
MLLPELKIIKKRRKELDLTQKQLAKQAGVSQSLIAKIESEKIEASYQKIKGIIETLDRLSEKEEKKCSQVMHLNVISVEEMDLVGKAVQLMKKHEISQLPVFQKERVTGSLTETGLLKALESQDKETLFEKKVQEIMEEAFPLVNKETPTKNILPLLKSSPAVLVMEKGQIKGIITKADLL